MFSAGHLGGRTLDVSGIALTIALRQGFLEHPVLTAIVAMLSHPSYRGACTMANLASQTPQSSRTQRLCLPLITQCL